jgi:hypothetical protein
VKKLDERVTDTSHCRVDDLDAVRAEGSICLVETVLRQRGDDLDDGTTSHFDDPHPWAAHDFRGSSAGRIALGNSGGNGARERSGHGVSLEAVCVPDPVGVIYALN